MKQKPERMIQKSLRFPEALADWLDGKAEDQRRSFNQIVVMELEKIQESELAMQVLK